METNNSRTIQKINKSIDSYRDYLVLILPLLAQLKFNVQLTYTETLVLAVTLEIAHDMEEWPLLSSKGRKAVRLKYNGSLSDGQLRTTVYNLRSKGILNRYNVIEPILFIKPETDTIVFNIHYKTSDAKEN